MIKPIIKQLWIEPTGFCNLRCKMCGANPRQNLFTKKTGFLSMKKFKKIIDKFKIFSPNLKRVDFRGTGEPLMNPYLVDMINFCTNNKIMTGITTNGVLLTKQLGRKIIKSGINTLTLSIESIRSDIYEKIRIGAKLNKVKENIKTFSKLMKSSKHNCVLQFNVVLLSENVNQIEEIIYYGKTVGVTGISLLNLENDLLKKEGTIIKNQKIYNLSFEELRNKMKNWQDIAQKHGINLYLPPIELLGDKSCPFNWKAPIITCDGFILPCCRMQEIKYSFGNIFEKPLLEIWQTKKFKTFRKGKYKFCDFCLKYLDRFEFMYWLNN